MSDPFAAFVLLAIALTLLVLLDVAAVYTGVDSRSSITDDHRR